MSDIIHLTRRARLTSRLGGNCVGWREQHYIGLPPNQNQCGKYHHCKTFPDSESRFLLVGKSSRRPGSFANGELRDIQLGDPRQISIPRQVTPANHAAQAAVLSLFSQEATGSSQLP